MTKYQVRTINGERTLTGGQAVSYMEAQDIAKESARQLGESVYLWYGDRFPVRVDREFCGCMGYRCRCGGR